MFNLPQIGAKLHENSGFPKRRRMKKGFCSGKGMNFFFARAKIRLRGVHKKSVQITSTMAYTLLLRFVGAEGSYSFSSFASIS
jgi:hypothetical protein